MMKMQSIMLLTIVTMVISGCTALNNISEGVSQKSISGSGTLISSRVGLDTTTQTPELYNLFVWGDYTSVVPGDEILRYEASTDASVFNSESKSSNLKILYASGNQERMDKFLELVASKIGTVEEDSVEIPEEETKDNDELTE